MNLFAFLFVWFPPINIASQIQYVKKSYTAVLKCHELQAPYTFSWQQLDKNLIYANENGINPNLTSALKNKLRLGDRFLAISNVSENDIGNYRCNSIGKATDIKVQFGESPSSIQVLQDNGTNIICGIEGHNITFTCIVTSDHQADETITWIQNGNVLIAGGPEVLSLSFVPTISDNLKTYTCRADNGIDPFLTYSVKLKLTLIPKISMMLSPSHKVIEGQKLEIKCALNTSAKILWIHKNTTVPGAFVKKEKEVNHGQSEVFVFSKVHRVDAGTFMCVANNSAGVNKAQSTIVVQYAPDVIINHDKRTNETMILICQAKGIPSKYTFEPWEHLTESRQHVRYVTGFNNGSTSRLLLGKSVESKRYQDSGIYVCRVSNSISDDSGQLLQNDSITLPYKGTPVFVSTLRNVQHGQLGKNFSLELFVFSDPNQSPLHSYCNISKELSNSTRCEHSCNQLKFNTSFHYAWVEVTGYKCLLAIQNIQESDFKFYTLTVSTKFGNNSFTVKLTPTNKQGSFNVIYTTVIVISTTIVAAILSTCWHRLNARMRRKRALEYTVNMEAVSGVAENSLYQLGTLPRSNSDEYSSIDRRSAIDTRFNSEVLVHTVAPNSGNLLSVVSAAHSYELSSTSDEYSSIDIHSEIDGRFDSDEFDSGGQFLQTITVHNMSENSSLVMHEEQESRRLHYAEVTFEDVGTRPLHNEPLIRELDRGAEYAEVDHTVKPNPLPESGSDVSSEEDFVNVRNIQQWRNELFK